MSVREVIIKEEMNSGNQMNKQIQWRNRICKAGEDERKVFREYI